MFGHHGVQLYSVPYSPILALISDRPVWSPIARAFGILGTLWVCGWFCVALVRFMYLCHWQKACVCVKKISARACTSLMLCTTSTVTMREWNKVIYFRILAFFSVCVTVRPRPYRNVDAGVRQIVHFVRTDNWNFNSTSHITVDYHLHVIKKHQKQANIPGFLFRLFWFEFLYVRFPSLVQSWLLFLMWQRSTERARSRILTQRPRQSKWAPPTRVSSGSCYNSSLIALADEDKKMEDGKAFSGLSYRVLLHCLASVVVTETSTLKSEKSSGMRSLSSTFHLWVSMWSGIDGETKGLKSSSESATSPAIAYTSLSMSAVKAGIITKKSSTSKSWNFPIVVSLLIPAWPQLR